MFSQGAVYTPDDVTHLLTEWAIRDCKNKILDLGVGEGAFTFSSYDKLLQLGQSSSEACKQIYGAEIDPQTYSRFQDKSLAKNLHFPNIINCDFFQTPFPKVDVVIGNPPYVRRRAIPADEIKQIRNSILIHDKKIQENDLSQLTDLYVYFLLKSFKNLKLGGRLGVIVADSWLNARYGEVLKSYLRTNFNIERLISFDRPIFQDAQVRAVLIFATRHRRPRKTANIPFTRVMNGLPAHELIDLFEPSNQEIADVSTTSIQAKKLKYSLPWGVHFKTPELAKQIQKNKSFIPLHKVADVKIGIQTLAKDFFTLTPEEVEATGIESRFLRPFAHTITDFDTAIIDQNVHPALFLFYCSKLKSELENTKALAYIQSGEQTKTKVRGSESIIIGYHNKQRIQQANRSVWYDLQTDVERRGSAPILIPRHIYKRYFVLWNKAGYIPGGAMIEFTPKPFLDSREREIKLFLAILNSTLIEVLIRGYAQLYGGGTSSIRLSQLKKTFIPNVTCLNETQQNLLIKAYDYFTVSMDRERIDNVIQNLFKFDLRAFQIALDDLRMMVSSTKGH